VLLSVVVVTAVVVAVVMVVAVVVAVVIAVVVLLTVVAVVVTNTIYLQTFAILEQMDQRCSEFQILNQIHVTLVQP